MAAEEPSFKNWSDDSFENYMDQHFPERTVPEMDLNQDMSLIKVITDADTQGRMLSCHEYMPYSERPNSCTETSMRTLGMLTEATFQSAAQLHREGKLGPSLFTTAESILSRVTNIPVTLTESTLEKIYSEVQPYENTLLCATRPYDSIYRGVGHTMIITKTQDNVPVLVDASQGHSVIGKDDIQAHLAEYNNFYVPRGRKIDAQNARFIPIGGMNPRGRIITLTDYVSRLVDQCKDSRNIMYTIVGSVMNKIFSDRLMLSSISVSNLLTGMKTNSATVIYGDNIKGHTMVLINKNNLILIDPVSRKKIVGSTSVGQYLKSFLNIFIISDSKTGGKGTKRKRKKRKRTYRMF
jgi:hypothetical protein